jgi:quinol monooxygenase YgiN
MKFVQIIEFSTSRIDEFDALEERWLKASEGKRTLQRQLKTRDRDDPNAYMLIVEFPSYEDAMRNNDLPETQEISEQVSKLAEGEVRFRNLDVLDERS